MFDPEDVLDWEHQQAAKRQPHAQSKRHKDPRWEKRKTFRKGIKAVHYHKEKKVCRHPHYRLYRNCTNQMVRAGHDDASIPVYKRTSGWLTW